MTKSKEFNDILSAIIAYSNIKTMGVKNIYERFIWFDDRVRQKKYPNTTSLAKQFEISVNTAQHEGERGDVPQRATDLFNGENIRQRLGLPLLHINV